MESKIEELRCELLQCAVCLGEMVRPRALQCLHSFCETCIQSHSNNYMLTRENPTSYFPCPSCRVLTILPPEGVQGLSKDFRTDKIGEVLRNFVQSLPTPYPHECNLCLLASNISRRAVKYCVDCNKNLCHSCALGHSRKPTLVSHLLLALSEQGDDGRHGNSGCAIHRNEAESYFCSPCNRSLCIACLSIHDDNHHVVRRDNVEYDVDAQQVTRRLQDQLWEIQEVMFRMTLQEGKLKSAYDATKLLIRKQSRKFMAKIMAEESRLLKRLDRIYREKSEALFQQKEECKGHLDEVESIQSRVHFLLTLNDGRKKVAEVNPTFQTKMDLLQAKVLSLENEVDKLSEFIKFAPSQNDPHLGTLNGHSFEVDRKREQQQQQQQPQHLSVSAQGNSPTLLTDVIEPFYDVPSSGACSSPVKSYGSDRSTSFCPSVKLLCRFGNTGSGIGEYSLPYTISFVTNDTIAVADLGNKRVQVVDKFGHCEKVIAQGEIMPRSLTLTRDGTIAITDEQDKTVKVFSLCGDLLNNLSMDSLSFPYGIACTSQRNFVVSDMIYESISIVGSMGRVIQRFGSHGRGDNCLDNPGCLFVDKEDNIFVSDTGNHCIKLFTKTGRFLNKIGCYGDKSGQLKYPKSVCMDSNGCLFVADSGNDRVVAFSTSGSFLGTVISKQNGMKRPTGLACNSQGSLLAVSLPDVGEIRVYEINKNWVMCGL